MPMPESTHSPRSAPRASLLAVAIGLGVTLAFSGLLLIALAIAIPGIALAQHDTHGHDTHMDEAVGEQIGGPREDHAGAGHDPSAHFNWVDFGYGSKDVNGGTLEEGEEPMSPPFIMTLFNFAVVVTILMWKVRPAIRRHVAKRHDSIKTALEEASLLREQARAKLDEYTSQLARAEKEIEQMVTDIRQGAEAEKQRILADAEAQAKALKRDAEQRIAAEIERARAALEREVVAAAIAVAERLIREQATKSDHTQLADSFIQDIQVQADTRPASVHS
jgi:F-type H+-transporting ATPase subunit b